MRPNRRPTFPRGRLRAAAWAPAAGSRPPPPPPPGAPRARALDARYVRTTDDEVLPSGGIGRYTLQLIRHAVELDPELRLRLVVRADNRRPIVAGPAGRRVQEIPFDAPPQGLRTLWRLARRVDLEGVELFHAPFNVLPYGLPCPAITTVHDVMWLAQPAYCMQHHLSRVASRVYFRAGMEHALRASRLILTVSEASRAAIAAWRPAIRDRIRVAHNGLEPWFRPLAPRDAERDSAHLVPAGTPFVLAVGQGSPYKNHRRAALGFVRAFAARPAMKLVLVRRLDRWGDRELRRLLDTPVGRARMIPLASVTDVELRALYNRARILLFPSLAEGFGLPVLEAMACGTPVVTSDVSALPEVSGDAALHVDPRSVPDIAAALRRLEDEPALRSELVQRGRRRAATFTWRECAQRVLEAWRTVAARPDGVGTPGPRR